MTDKLLQSSLEEIKRGYSFDAEKESYTCLVCGKVFEKGEVFPFEGRFFEASRAVGLHIGKEHGNMLDILASYDKKYTGITENQRELLKMSFEGLSDRKIAEKSGVSPATIRHQHFVFREKAKQAKLYLAMFELVEKAMSESKEKEKADDFIEVHRGAKMVDDRYFITKEEEEKIIAGVFKSLQPLKLKVFSPKEKKKIVILKKISTLFKSGVNYSEKEVNAILEAVYDDFATIRRYLIEYGYMNRTKDCRTYWLT